MLSDIGSSLGEHSFGSWVQGKERKSSRSSPLINPSTGKAFAEVCEADPDTISSAVSGARDAFRDWRNCPAGVRSDLLRALADNIRSDAASMAELLCLEAGKPIAAARDEVSSAAGLLDYFAGEAIRLHGEIPLVGNPRERVLVTREPIGVIVAITPFNYPLSTLSCKIGPALAAGCTVLAKPDEHTPLSTLAVARCASKAGLPPGVLNVLTGPGTTVGAALVQSPVPRLVTFTGSTRVGKEIQAAGARWVRQTILELGGHCPAIVCSDSPWREILPQIVAQSLKNCGQYCYRVSRVYVAREIYDEFLSAFASAISSLRVGPAEKAGVDIGPLNNPRILERVTEQVQMAVRDGARLESIAELPPDCQGGFFYPPTLLSGVDPGMSVLEDEIFGPVVMIAPFDSLDQAVALANGTRFGLAAYLFTSDLGTAMRLSDIIEAGSVWVNKIHQSYVQAPFGGMKESGLGREKSHFGVEEFTELKTIYLSW